MSKCPHIAGVIERALRGDADLTLTGLGIRLGGSAEKKWPEETMRSYRDGDTSPSYDRVASACRRQSTPGGVVLDFGQTLLGPRAIVCLVDVSDVPPGTKPGHVMDETIALTEEAVAFMKDVRRRTADGVICADDAAEFAKFVAALRGRLERAVRFSQHCAAAAARRS